MKISSAFAKHRTLAGIVLIVISYLLGWPAIGVCTALAIKLGDPKIGIIGGPAFYIFSWIVFLAGIWILGKESYQRFKAGGFKGLWKRITRKT